MRHLFAALTALAALGATVTSAAAECGEPRPRISPPDAARVPIDPHVYLFIEADTWATRDDWMRIEQDGRGLPFHTTELGRNGTELVLRLDISTDVASPLTIWYGPSDGWDNAVVTYIVEHEPAPDQARLVAAARVVDRWSCSFTDALGLEIIGNAVAYRLEWARSAEALAARPMGKAWLWPHPADAELRAAAGPYATTDQLLIGHESCRGRTIPAGALDEPRATRLVALFADGHEAVIDTGMLQIGHGTARLPELGGQAAVSPVVAPATSPAPVEIELTLPWSALVATAASGACAALGVVLALRSRRRRAGSIGTLGDPT